MNEMKEKEYDRIAAEIRQNQAIRITLFTFSVTACAALLGLSEKIMAEKPVLMFGAVYVVLVPSIILVHHYTRSIDSLSEYLRVFHEEKWMEMFDTMTEGFAKYADLGFLQRVLQKRKLYSTGWALAFAYFLLVIFVVVFGLLKFDTGIRSRSILLGGAVFTICVLWVFRSLGKKAYREVWGKIKQETF
jgi:hypothetical protein